MKSCVFCDGCQINLGASPLSRCKPHPLPTNHLFPAPHPLRWWFKRLGRAPRARLEQETTLPRSLGEVRIRLQGIRDLERGCGTVGWDFRRHRRVGSSRLGVCALCSPGPSYLAEKHRKERTATPALAGPGGGFGESAGPSLPSPLLAVLRTRLPCRC